jgi:hypothetical protein
MPISENDFQDDACSGVAEQTFQDLDQIQNQIEAFLQETLPLCMKYLPGFADGTIKKKGEKELAVSLCKRLIAFGDDKGVLFTFFNEDPDINKKSRTDDMAVIPSVGMAYLKVGPHYYDCEDQLYIIEAKRLPPPPSRAGQDDRSREYVISDWEHCSYLKKSRTGGIERFKEGLHGGAFARSAMVAFVQQGTPDGWLEKVNSWIDELVGKTIPTHKACWGKDDLLRPLSGSAKAGLSEFQSKHFRPPGRGHISLRHYWLLLN